MRGPRPSDIARPGSGKVSEGVHRRGRGWLTLLPQLSINLSDALVQVIAHPDGLGPGGAQGGGVLSGEGR